MNKRSIELATGERSAERLRPIAPEGLEPIPERFAAHSGMGGVNLEANIVLLPGDGVGPEVVNEGRKV
ncbi:MAG: hypothetical protein ACE5M4_12180, partial [Anaerolineales bacterium]